MKSIIRKTCVSVIGPDEGGRLPNWLTVERSFAVAPPRSVVCIWPAGPPYCCQPGLFIAWQTLNAVRRPASKRFTRVFLVVAPGLTIKDRLRVLQPNDPDSYYASLELLPGDMLDDVKRAKIVITNFHSFKLRQCIELSAGGRALLQGRGEELNTLETEGQMLQRVMPELMGMKNILVLNDEAHHCYREAGLREITERTGDPRKAETITDQELLREVMNTVGKQGQLGGSIRCVVSVSMLTEGWDANTVTHVLGLRAFGTQLLKRISKQWLDTCLVCKGDTYPALLMYQELADMACNRITAAITAASRGERPIKALLDPYNPTGSTRHVRFTTSKIDRWETRADRCHINWVILDSDWEAEFCRVAESHPQVKAYAKNHNLGLEVPYRYGSENRKYRPDFIVLVDDGHGDDDLLHLIVEIKGYRREDAKEKKSTMDTYWVPGVNHLATYGRWAFAEFVDVYQIAADFKAKVESEFNRMIEDLLQHAPTA